MRPMMDAANPSASALAVVSALRAGQYQEICAVFGPELRALVSPRALRKAWEGEAGKLGELTEVGAPVVNTAAHGTVVKVPVIATQGGLTVSMSIAATGLLNGFRLDPPGLTESWAAPSYVDESRFTEQELTLGTGPLSVPGTLSLPTGPGPHPAVVLLHGGGVFDRDETAGRNKPLKDLAWGLASQGIAVLRFDKVTHARALEVAKLPSFTMVDEYLPHTVDAVRQLGQHPAIDARRIFVLGHSLGARIAPRVAAAEPAIAGLVLLAGDTQPMHWSAVRVLRYLAALDANYATALGPMIEDAVRSAELIDNGQLSPDTPADQLPFGWSAPFWLDARDYRPAEVAATVHRPMYIAQGRRDYQVTEADDLPGWRAALAGRTDVTIRVYEADDHMFFPGSGPSTPAGYDPAQHVDPEVVADVAAWLLRH